MLSGHGLFGIKLGSEFDLSLADIAGIVIIFGIFSSIILKILVFLFIQCLIHVKYSRLFRHDSISIYQRPFNYVSISELARDALSGSDDLSLKMYFDEKNKIKKYRKESNMSEVISLGVFLVFLFEWYLSAFDGSSRMFIDWLWDQLMQRDPTIEHYFVGSIISLFLFFYALMVCWPKNNYYHIYYPKLAEKIRKKEEKNFREIK